MKEFRSKRWWPNWVEIGEDATIDPSVQFIPYENEKVIIGKRVKIDSGTKIYGGTTIGNDSGIGHNNVIRFKTTIGVHSVISHFCDLEGNITIGNHTFVHTHNGIGQKTIIGSYVFVGPFCVFMNDPKIIFYRAGYSQPGGDHFKMLQGPTLNDGCRIGAGSILFPKINVGKHALIGAGSIVTKSVPDFTIAFGNPAIVRGSVDPNEDRIVECANGHS
jgi:acetyltransferase-like isoleucine patch superfamily enzyme